MLALTSFAAAAIAACGVSAESSDKDGALGAASPEPHASSPGAALPDGGARSPAPDAAVGDASSDAAPDGGGEEPTTPGIAFIGRFDTSDAAGPRMAWPGSRVVARFDGTTVKVRLSQTNGYGGGPSYFNVIVDGARKQPIAITGAGQELTLASGLAAGPHVVELEKRTEPNLGTVRFEGFTFTGGAGLLVPPQRPARRIEILSDSTINGFGVDGDRATTCANGAPAQFNDASKSVAMLAANALSAEAFLLAYSGKGLTKNQSPTDTVTFRELYKRSLPEAETTWSFAAWTPDVVVLSLGGTDMDGLAAAPAGFQAAYDALVGDVRQHYPNAHVFGTIWSQIKDMGPPNTRSAMRGALNAVIAGRKAAGDAKLWLFEFPEANGGTDETGCYHHANAAHHQAMSALLVAEIKQRLGW